MAALLGLGLLLVTVVLAQYAIVRLQPGAMTNELRNWLASVQEAEQKQQQSYMRESLDTMAKRMGEMQAQVLRLDALGARLAKTAGMKPQDFSFDEPPAQGGPYIPAPQQQDISLDSMNQQLGSLSQLMNDRNDKLVALETLLMQDQLSKRMFPSAAPVKHGWYSSNFGWRIDPFTGKQAMHEGVDYMVPTGTPVFASAGGIVTYADLHPQYGNMVEIDHGNGIVTRYAHASKLLVRDGQMVRRGQEIALSGSTGRSTGPHLHFEVRYKGVAQNPVRFLQKAAAG
ncbi:MAG: peptidoglycan DD-metalloendopeptidase family protein [Sideroxydans sp.]|nr:peptidoglycan DD-metalloendopeptidase family protein [Sideroxydans sp.]